MSAAAGFLEFFILEASDYVEQLDGLLLGGGSVGPDGEAMQRAARALRGTATMAKIPAFAELAAALERVGRGMQDGILRWEPALAGAVVAAIDDLKSLLHAARAWSPAEDRRARERAGELARYAPLRASPTPTSSASVSASGGMSPFLATEAANIAAGLELLTARAGDQDTAGNVLRRIRALRGVAGVKEIGPLADALEATEDAARGLELSGEDLAPDARRLLEAAAGYLRTLSSSLRVGGDVNAPNPTRDAFEAARAVVESRDADRERVVPIARLFYEDGEGGVLEASQHPPTTAAERFRLELVSLGEHLRQVIHSARLAGDASASPRIERDVRRALRALEAAADSFGEREIAEFVRSQNRATSNIDFLSLSGLDDLAAALTEPGAQGDRLIARLRELSGRRALASAIGAGFGRATPPATVARSAPVAPPGPSAPAPAAPIAARPSPVVQPRVQTPPPFQVHAPAARVAPVTPATASPSLLDRGISALDSFSARRHLTPAPIPEDDDTDLVPIETLLYRGRAALDRAAQVRDGMKQSGAFDDREALDELFDLIELARAE
jgi:HPt (histidine-containing phosphotransfer) domain-containing protein